MRWRLSGQARWTVRAALLLCGLACAAGAVIGCGGGGRAASAAPPGVEVLKTPDGGIQPQAVVDASGTLHLIYLKGKPDGGDLFYRRREAGQSEWSAPVRVNSQPATATAAGTIRGGQLAVGKNARVHVVWFGAGKAQPRGPLNPAMPADSPYNGTPLLYSRLNDAGSAFEPQRNLMQITFALDGGPSVAADAQGNVYAIWHAGSGTGTGEGARRLWVARSRDEGKTFARETPAWDEQTGACACCGAKGFADSKGNVYALYRMALNKSQRDMVLLASADTGRSFQGARIDPWPVDT